MNQLQTEAETQAVWMTNMSAVLDAADPFEVPERTPEAIAQDDRQAADFAGFEPTYHAALVVIANEPGAGRFARAIDLVAAIWGKTSNQVLQDACVIA